MQYSGHATGQDICTLADKKCGQNSASFPIIDKTLYANEGMRIIQSWIHEAYGGWIFDDKNNTDFPEATTALVSAQQDYALPVDASFVHGVSIKDQSGNWKILKPITLEQIQEKCDEAEFYETNGDPEFYRPLSGSVKLYPASNFSQDASLKLHYTRDISYFETTDTIKVPGFNIQYHEALPVYMALQFSSTNSLTMKNKLQEEWDGEENKTGREGGYKKIIKSDYSRKLAQLFPPHIRVKDMTSEYE